MKRRSNEIRKDAIKDRRRQNKETKSKGNEIKVRKGKRD